MQDSGSLESVRIQGFQIQLVYRQDSRRILVSLSRDSGGSEFMQDSKRIQIQFRIQVGFSQFRFRLFKIQVGFKKDFCKFRWHSDSSEIQVEFRFNLTYVVIIRVARNLGKIQVVQNLVKIYVVKNLGKIQVVQNSGSSGLIKDLKAFIIKEWIQVSYRFNERFRFGYGCITPNVGWFYCTLN